MGADLADSTTLKVVPAAANKASGLGQPAVVAGRLARVATHLVVRKAAALVVVAGGQMVVSSPALTMAHGSRKKMERKTGSEPLRPRLCKRSNRQGLISGRRRLRWHHQIHDGRASNSIYFLMMAAFQKMLR